MTVNLNTDDNGQLKADPLVKRIVGQPGEQLVMQDGVLYYRTKNDDTFVPSKIDEKYANWDLNALSPKIKRKIQYFPLTQDEYETMLSFENQRREYDLNVAEFQAKQIVNSLYSLRKNVKLQGTFQNASLSEYDIFKNIQNLSQNVLMQNGGVEWLEEFLLSWIPSKNVIKDMYSESNYKLNVMTKITIGNLVLRYAQLIIDKTPASLWSSDSVLKENMEMANKLNWYIQGLLDLRNMPIFPANDKEGNPQYLPEKCYFMMGDNRFNSLDLRHSMDQSLKALSAYDKMSVEYYSMMSPQYINQKYIIGKPVYKFWPLDRMGFVE
jgi:signal peptidase I